MEIFVKDPEATVDYGIDWAAGYLEEGETINSSSWDVFPSPETGGLLVDHIPAFLSTSTAVFVTGGVLGHLYRLTNRIITSHGRTDERTIALKIGEK